MKYRPLNDVIDPEMPALDLERAFGELEDPDAVNDAYVMNDDGVTVQEPYVAPAAVTTSKFAHWAKPAAYLLCVTCVLLTFWNVNRVASGPDLRPPPSPFQIKQALYLGVMKVDAYRKAHGVTPESLTDVGLPEDAYSYRRVDSGHYILAFQNDSPMIEYDSQVPKESFFGSPRTMLSMGDSK